MLLTSTNNRDPDYFLRVCPRCGKCWDGRREADAKRRCYDDCLIEKRKDGKLLMHRGCGGQMWSTGRVGQ